VLKINWTTCSKYGNYSRLNIQYDSRQSGGGVGKLYDHLMCTRITTLIMIEIFIWCIKIYEEIGYGLNLDLPTISYQSEVPYPSRRSTLHWLPHLVCVTIRRYVCSAVVSYSGDLINCSNIVEHIWLFLGKILHSQ
jgi:hypothetical protein